MLLGTILGTATSNLWKLLEHYFSGVEDPDEEKAAEASSLINLLKAQKEEREQEEEAPWEVLKVFDSEAMARVSGAAETVDYFL